MFRAISQHIRDTNALHCLNVKWVLNVKCLFTLFLKKVNISITYFVSLLSVFSFVHNPVDK